MLTRYIRHAGDERAFIIAHLPEQGAWTIQNALIMGFFDLAMEHHWVILDLLDRPGCEGSALALVRPFVEACYRLHWVTKFDASTQQQLWNGTRKFLSLENTVNEVVKHYKQTEFGPVFAKILESRDVLNDLTHGGMQQFRCRFRGRIMEPNYPQQMLIDALRITTGLLAFTAVVYCLCVDSTPENPSASALVLGKRLETVVDGFRKIE